MQIKAPYGWRPEDIKAQPINAPPAHSRYRKFDLYRNVQQFFHIDNHAIQVGISLHLTCPPFIISSGMYTANQLFPDVWVLGKSLQLSPRLAHLIGSLFF
jgi:hypothetical protein